MDEDTLAEAGAPLRRLHTQVAPAIDGLEVALKGGLQFFFEAKGGMTN